MPTVAYILTRFPVLSQTFVVREIDELSRCGFHVQPYSLLPVRSSDMPGRLTAEWSERTVYLPSVRDARVVGAGLRLAATRRGWAARFLGRTVVAHRGRPRRLAVSLANFSQAAYLVDRLRASEATWIHAHFAGSPATVAWLIHGLTGMPYSFTPHAVDLYCRSYVDGFLVDKIRDARFVVAISEYNRAHLARLVGGPPTDERFPLVRCGIESRYLEAPPPRDGHDVAFIVSVGRLVEKKGHEYLLHALHLLSARGYAFRCMVVGDGPLRAQLSDRITALSLEGTVMLAGNLAPEEVPEVLDQADIFCLASVIAGDGDRDGLPVVLLEAMARGLPVVATNVTGIPEAVRHEETGLLVSERDAEALAAALARLLEDSALRHRLGRRGRDCVAKDFALRTQVRRLARRLSEELGTPGAPAAPRAVPMGDVAGLPAR